MRRKCVHSTAWSSRRFWGILSPTANIVAVMANAAVEVYRQHQVWEVLQLKSEALKTARYGNASIERMRINIQKMLEYALRSRDNAQQSFLYVALLNDLQGLVNQIPSDEGQFHNWASNYLPQLEPFVRQLPGPAPRNMPQSYVDQLDEAIRVREAELSTLREEIESLREQVKLQESAIANHAATVTQQEKAVTTAREQVEEIATSTESALNQSFEESLMSWMNERDQKDSVLNDRMQDQVSLLTAAAQVGQRLVEHAAGNLTALDWTKRAKRERRNGLTLRALAVVFGFAGLGLAYYIVDRAVKKDFDLTVGDGLLRAGAILAVIAVGGYFAAESRRHYTESDTAEEVATAMLAIEPYYAAAEDKDRTDARNAVGETVFVKNVLSRFASRDAGRHNEAVTSQDLAIVVAELTKALNQMQQTAKTEAHK